MHVPRWNQSMEPMKQMLTTPDFLDEGKHGSEHLSLVFVLRMRWPLPAERRW